MSSSLTFIEYIIFVLGLGGFVYGFYCQTKARQFISKEKVAELKDVSIIATGPMPPKEILREEGLKYHKGFNIGVAIFAGSIILLALIR